MTASSSPRSASSRRLVAQARRDWRGAAATGVRIAAVAVAALGVWRAAVHVAALHRPMPVRSAWPVMLVARGPDARTANDALTQIGVPVEPPARGDERTAALALRALSKPELRGLQRALEELAERLETQTDPMVEDLDDSDPMAPIARMMRTFLPTLTACEALGERRRAAPDGTMVTAVNMECGVPGGNSAAPLATVDCVPLWQSAPEDRYVARARFLEWPVAGAVVLGFADSGHARNARDALRQHARDAGSRVAVVFDGQDLAGTPDEAVDAVRVPAARAVALVRRGRPDLRLRGNAHVLDLIAGAPSSEVAPVPWLRLDGEEVLVVPKLSALTDLETFAVDVQRALPLAMPVEWVRRPDPIR